VWRTIRTTGGNDEHDDYKVRTEQRFLKELREAVTEKEAVIAKMIGTHELIEKEKAHVKDMVRIASGDDPQKQTGVSFTNPLNQDNDQDDDQADDDNSNDGGAADNHATLND
jgi:hypothetical protein